MNKLEIVTDVLNYILGEGDYRNCIIVLVFVSLLTFISRFIVTEIISFVILQNFGGSGWRSRMYSSRGSLYFYDFCFSLSSFIFVLWINHCLKFNFLKILSDVKYLETFDSESPYFIIFIIYRMSHYLVGSIYCLLEGDFTKNSIKHTSTKIPKSTFNSKFLSIFYRQAKFLTLFFLHFCAKDPKNYVKFVNFSGLYDITAVIMEFTNFCGYFEISILKLFCNSILVPIFGVVRCFLFPIIFFRINIPILIKCKCIGCFAVFLTTVYYTLKIYQGWLWWIRSLKSQGKPHHLRYWEANKLPLKRVASEPEGRSNGKEEDIKIERASSAPNRSVTKINEKKVEKEKEKKKEDKEEEEVGKEKTKKPKNEQKKNQQGPAKAEQNKQQENKKGKSQPPPQNKIQKQNTPQSKSQQKQNIQKSQPNQQNNSKKQNQQSQKEKKKKD
jgi:hypothetical protein